MDERKITAQLRELATACCDPWLSGKSVHIDHEELCSAAADYIEQLETGKPKTNTKEKHPFADLAYMMAAGGECEVCGKEITFHEIRGDQVVQGFTSKAHLYCWEKSAEQND